MLTNTRSPAAMTYSEEADCTSNALACSRKYLSDLNFLSEFPSQCRKDGRGRLYQVVSQAEVYQHARRPAREYHVYRVHHAPGDTDLLIVQKAVESAAIVNTVLVGDDIDLLILLR